MKESQETGLVGIDGKCVCAMKISDNKDEIQKMPLEFKKMKNEVYPNCWGVAIFGKKENYYEIPNELKIYCGDNYLIKMNEDNGKNNYKISNCKIKHIGSLTSSSIKLGRIEHEDMTFYSKYDSRFSELIKEKELSFTEKIFSLVNTADRQYKLITILGMKFKLKRNI